MIFEKDGVKGFLHQPPQAPEVGVVLAHGAGSNCNSPLLVSLCEFLSAAGYLCLRIDLPFRQERKTGPPFPAIAAKDRAGLAKAVECMRELGVKRVVLGGHSYGGRQATMLAAESPEVADALLLLSYPLYPPRKPQQARTAHLPSLRTPSLFVHGTRDPFGTADQLTKALEVMPGPKTVLTVEGAGHDLKGTGRHRANAFFPEIQMALERLLR